MQANNPPVKTMMGPIESFISCMEKYFDFSGVATRAEYWWFQLLTTLLVFIPLIVFANIGSDKMIIVWLISCPIFFAIPIISLTVRRLHDVGYSGLYFFVTLIPVVGGLIFLYLMLQPSSEHPYGK